mgnify:CR=1 FL=1
MDTAAAAPVDMSAPDAKRGGGTGRRHTRERRQANAAIAGPPYITRAIPTYDVLGEESLQRIEKTAERILAATVRVACLDADTYRPRRLPAALRGSLE